MLTPGVSVSRSSNLRPSTGVVAIVASPSVEVEAVVVTSISGAAVTTTSSDTPPTRRAKRKVVVRPTVSVRFFWIVGANPSLIIVTWYCPGFREGNSKCPDPSVRESIFTPVFTSRAVTAAPGMAAPPESATSPWMRPFSVWTCAGRLENIPEKTKQKAMQTAMRRLFMKLLWAADFVRFSARCKMSKGPMLMLERVITLFERKVVCVIAP